MKDKAIRKVRGVVKAAAPSPENRAKMRAFLDSWIALATKREKEKSNEQHPELHPENDTAPRA